MSLSLNDKLNLIGIRVSSNSKSSFINQKTDIEQVLVEAILEFPEDARLASLVF